MHTFQNISGCEGGWPRLRKAALHKPLYKVSFHWGVKLLTEPEGAQTPARPSDVMKTDFRPETWGGDKPVGQTHWNNKQNRACVTESEDGRVYPKCKHLIQ